MKTLEQMYDAGKPYCGEPLADDMGGPAGRVHDWRNHIGDLDEIWSSLSREARMAVAIIAEHAASREEWE